MKRLLMALAVGFALPCWAQKNLAEELAGGGALKKAFSPAPISQWGGKKIPKILRGARVVQGKILPGGPRPLNKTTANIERYLFRQVRPEGVSLLNEPTEEQYIQSRAMYDYIMRSFEAFKREMDVFLYYQSKEDEKRTLAAGEQAEWMQKIGKIYHQLLKLKPFISPQDPAYKAALEYVAYAAETVSPVLRGMFVHDAYYRQDRVYVPDEFFLRKPAAFGGAELNELSIQEQAHRIARQLPEKLKLAVLNDRPSVLQRMKTFQQAGAFFPGWEISYYDSMEEFFRDMSAHEKQFDMILTDIFVPGGGGFYLTGILRSKGFHGVILALAAFPEQSHTGKKMFALGFDGLISAPFEFEYGDHWPIELMRKVRHYFYYRNLHQWKR